MIKFCFAALCAACILLPAPAARASADADQVKADSRKQVVVRQKTQKSVDKAAEKSANLLDRLENLRKDLKTTRDQRKRTDAYVADMRGRVSELQRRVVELERIGREMEPCLMEASARLGEYVSRDLPFLPEERAKRLQGLQGVLNRYQAPINAKLRRLLEVLEIEARYGATVSAKELELEIDGARKLVRVFRLGRLALFALSTDGARAWRFDAAQGRYVELSSYQSELALAADVAARKRVVELVDLPVGRPVTSMPAREAEK